MPVKVTVESVLAGKDAFETAKRRAEELNRNQRSQFAERERIIKLQSRLAATTDRQQKAAIRAEIAERRRGLQLARLKDQEEKAVTRELKQQISSQRRLNRLTQRLNRDLEKQQRQRSLLGRLQAGGAGTALALGGGALAAGDVARRGVEFARESIQLAREQAAVEAQLEARLRSTGGAAGLTSGELKNLARELQSVTNIGDEATIAAEAMLLSFTNIGRETFPRATKAILDTATAMNNGATPSAEQLRNVTVQLGKVLNDPVSNLGALTRTGVTFTQQQKDQIKTLAESGRLFEAQAIILAELEKEFGGSAEAAREADGGFIALTNSIGDFKEAVGAAIQPSGEFNELLIRQVDSTTNALNALTRLAETHNKLNETGDQTTDMLTRLDTFARAAQNPVGALNLFIGEASDNTDAWAQALIEAENEQKSAVKTATDLSDALEDNSAAAEDNAAALEEAQKRLEKVNEIRRDFAGSLIDIEEKAQEDSTEQWEDYYDELDDEADKFKDRITDLEEKAGKDRVAIGKKLAKDLAKLDHDLNRDREKVNADTQKKIKRLKEDAAREDKSERRKRQIDAMGDERLFQFELRNLAAEGEFLQIQQAQKRRKIEQQIAAEKRQEEGRAESDDLQVKIRRIKQDAQDRNREAQAQARERRELLKEQAEEDKEALAEQLQEQKELEAENLQERLDALKETNREKLDNINKTRQKNIEKLGRELTETGDLTRTELQKLVPVAGEFGDQAGAAFAEGMSAGFERNQRIAELLGDPGAIMHSQTFGGGPGAGAGFGSTPGTITGFQHGGRFVVGGAGGPDSQMVRFRATPGEEVTVSPPGRAGGGVVVNYSPTINVPPGSSGEMLEAIKRIVEDQQQELVDTITDQLGT